jgi:hypothetical protein
MKEKKDQTIETKVKSQFSRVRVRLFALRNALAWPTSSMVPGDDTPVRTGLPFVPTFKYCDCTGTAIQK